MRILTNDLTAELASELLTSRIIAVDTETSGLSWRDDRLELCQLYTPTTGPILVRRIDRNPAELARVLGAPGSVKVFHFAPFDLRFLQHQCGIAVANVACTKAASKILDPELPARAHSLADLTRRYLDITLEKGSVRTSDWGADVLSPEQAAYAAADVTHLPDLFQVLKRRLDSAGLTQTWRSVCDYMVIDSDLEVRGVPNPLTY